MNFPKFPKITKRRNAIATAVLAAFLAVAHHPTDLWAWSQFIGGLALAGFNANKAVDSKPDDEPPKDG